MDILFKCPNCEQELEVDDTGAGSKIECPSCGQTITVPETESGTQTKPVPAPASESDEEPQPRAGSAAVPPPPPPPPPVAGPSKTFSVPSHAAPSEVLITKSAKPLEVAAKESDKKMRIKTIKRTECLEVGKDHFDEIVSRFIDMVGQPNVISISPVSYSTLDLASHQILTDYGAMIVYRG